MTENPSQEVPALHPETDRERRLRIAKLNGYTPRSGPDLNVEPTVEVTPVEPVPEIPDLNEMIDREAI